MCAYVYARACLCLCACLIDDDWLLVTGDLLLFMLLTTLVAVLAIPRVITRGQYLLDLPGPRHLSLEASLKAGAQLVDGAELELGVLLAGNRSGGGRPGWGRLVQDASNRGLVCRL